MVASETNEKMDDIIWNLPLLMTYKCLSLVYATKTGEEVKNHKEREVIKRQQEKFTEITTNE